MVRRHEDARRRATDIGVIGVGDQVYRSGATAYRPTATSRKKMFLTWWEIYPSVLVFSLLPEQHPYLLHPVVSLFRDGHCRTNSHPHIAAAIYPSPRIVVLSIRAACRSEVVIIAVTAIIQEPTWDQQRRMTHVASHSKFIVSNGS